MSVISLEILREHYPAMVAAIEAGGSDAVSEFRQYASDSVSECTEIAKELAADGLMALAKAAADALRSEKGPGYVRLKRN